MPWKLERARVVSNLIRSGQRSGLVVVARGEFVDGKSVKGYAIFIVFEERIL